MPHDRIILSAKVSGVQDLVDVYRALAARCDYALHLGLTEAGMGSKGIVATTAGLAILLQEGIGDTIRTSLTPLPNGDRTEEVIVSQQILQSLGIRSFTPQVTACPGCGRTTSTFFQDMADQIQTYLREQMPVWKAKHPGVESMKVAVMGCVVNGPGESKHANLGISLPGTFEEPKAPVFVDGRLMTTLKGDHIVAEFIGMLDDYVAAHYAGEGAMSKLFTLREAEQLLPQIRDWMREAVSLKSRYDEAEHAVRALAERIMVMGGIIVDSERAAEDKARRENAGQHLKSILENIRGERRAW